MKNLKDVIAIAKTQRLTCSGPGLGTTPMLSAEYLFKVLGKLGTALSGAKYSFSQQDAIVSVARDLAQTAIAQHGAAAMSATATLTANAEHSVLTGKISQAIAAFAKAYTVARSIKAAHSGSNTAARTVRAGGAV